MERINDRLRLEALRHLAPILDRFREDHSGPTRFGHRNVQTSGWAGAHHDDGVVQAGACLLMRCQHRTARLRQGTFNEGEAIGQAVHDAVHQDFMG